MATADAPPTRFAAGDTLRFAVSLADYSAADGWALSYRLVGLGVALTIGSTANGAGWTVEAPAASTAALTVAGAGVDCQLFGYVAKGAERFQVYAGPCRVLPNIATATGDLRGHAASMLAAIEALLQNRATIDQQSYKIADRELVRMTVPELLRWRDYYKLEVQREAAAAGLALGRQPARRIDVRFGPRT